MEWIKIDIEKPILGQFVIVSDGHHVGEGIFAPNDDFIIFNHNVVEPWTKITHWMLLPTPPKHNFIAKNCEYQIKPIHNML